MRKLLALAFLAFALMGGVAFFLALDALPSHACGDEHGFNR
jgi:hypothetical protein